MLPHFVLIDEKSDGAIVPPELCGIAINFPESERKGTEIRKEMVKS